MSNTDEQYPYQSGPEETRENKSLEWLVDPIQPMIFDPQPGGADLPPAAGLDSGEGASDAPSDAAPPEDSC